MKIVIAEDDPSLRKLLKHFIKHLVKYEIIGEVCNGEELIEFVTTKKPEIALVDIGMPELNGMEAIKSCKMLFPGLQVIFITGNEEYAVRAFDVGAADYIVKPVERARLYTALQRASERLKANKDTGKKDSKNLLIKQYNHMTFIPFDDIFFIERTERKTVIHTRNQQFEINDSLTNLLKVLDSRFMVSHRSYIINLSYLSRVEAYGNMYKAYFNGYDETARIAKQKLPEIQLNKSV
ncbi:DNA-binding response regulator [Bacillus sp. T33-2]|nr:DNA-binding response regulator [Bacillus sp. T33-2]